MRLFLASLAVLFAASLAGYLVVRLRSPEWPPPGSPPLPRGLWVSTLVLLASARTMRRAEHAARAGRPGALRSGLAATLVLGLVFFSLQMRNWWVLAAADAASGKTLFGFTFYMLTGLHAAHVLGGLLALGVVLRRARTGAYDAGEVAGVSSSALYWHFLDVVWLVLFAVLLIGQA
jgi:cytochrome c oxidase subunit 3